MAVYRAKPLQPVSQGQELIVAAQRAVRKSIPGNRKTTFCSESDTSIEAFPDGKVRVSGWVDLITEGGRPERQNYSVVIFKNSANQWKSQALTLAPQM